MLVGTIYGCALDGETYAGRVENSCMTNGTGYVDLCGPRGLATDMLSDAEWRNTYTLHRDFKDTLLQHYAGKFEQLSVELGGEGNAGNTAHRLAASWFNRDVTLGDDQSAAFIRGVCREMRSLHAVDGGPEHTDFQAGSMEELTLGLLYEHCKYSRGLDTCNVPFSQDIIDFSYEVGACIKSQPECLRDRSICLGRCNGDAGAKLTQDFATMAVKQELSVSALGSEALARGRANCTVESRVIEIPMFASGESFQLYSARLRTRGGFTAVDPRACRREPAACAAIQRVLERDPTLTFDTNTGRFRHAYSLTPPYPPPPPLPPPILVQYNIKSPPPPPAPPPPPPPWYESLEVCVPIITPAEAGLDSTQTQIDEERAVCVYVRALADERIRASRCFAALSPFPPPPPPLPRALVAAFETALRRTRVQNGGTAGAQAAADPTNENEYVREHLERNAQVNALLDRLSAENLQLRGVLAEIRPKLVDQQLQGRRLFERLAGTQSHKLEDSIKYGEYSIGGGALIGLTVAQCGSLCAALTNNTDSVYDCAGIMYRMAEPEQPANLQTAYCFMLRTTGSCTPIDFASSIFSRRDTSGCRTPTTQDNPACVMLNPQGRTDLRILDYAAARSSCRQGKGSPRMPRPRSSIEAFSFVGYAKERGASSFWAEKPIPQQERQLTHWSGLDGKPFYYPGNFDRRCILVTTQSDNQFGFMYARMAPCNEKIADAVVCESGAAAPPPPPGSMGTSVLPPPTPPPPPIGVSASLKEFIKREIRPRTEAICLAGLLDSDLGKLCTEFATMLSQPSSAGVLGSFMPQCLPEACWHSCSAESSIDVDNFEQCRSTDCVDTICRDFLLRYV